MYFSDYSFTYNSKNNLNLGIKTARQSQIERMPWRLITVPIASLTEMKLVDRKSVLDIPLPFLSLNSIKQNRVFHGFNMTVLLCQRCGSGAALFLAPSVDTVSKIGQLLN